MLDFGLPELLVILAIAVFVIGPKDIPGILYSVGRVFRRFQYVRYAMSQQFDDVLKAGDIEELRRGVNFESPQTNEKAQDEELDIQKEAEPETHTETPTSKNI